MCWEHIILSHPSALGLLGPRPGNMSQPTLIATSFPPSVASMQQAPIGLMTSLHGVPPPSQYTDGDWVMDTGTSSHMANHPSILTSSSPPPLNTSIIVGNGAPMPVHHMGNSTIPTFSFTLYLHNILILPYLIKNLIFVHALTRDSMSELYPLLHCDVWTSPIISNSGFKFYLVILDDFSHFTWSFLLRHKPDVLPTLIVFHAFVLTQFQHPIVCLQTDNGKEFDNHASRSFFSGHGIFLRLTCPYTSQQNGHIECTLRTLNDSMRTMLLHASTPLNFWPDALATSTYLLNCRSYRVCQHITPHELLGHALDYNHLRVF
jgi:transposase InsO family protein